MSATCPGNHIVHGGPAALIGHVNRLHSRRRFDHFEGQMRDAADAGRGIIHLLRQRARIRDELGDRVGRHVVRNRQNQRRGGGRRDRIIVLDRIERGFLVESLADAECVLRHQERIAIRLRSRDIVPGDGAAGARFVLDDNRLTQRLAQLLRDLAGKGVGCAAGRKCYDQADRPVGIGGSALRLRDSRGAEQGT